MIPVIQLNQQRQHSTAWVFMNFPAERNQPWICVLYKSTAVHTAGWSVSAASHSWDVRGHALKLQCSGMFLGLMVLVSIPPSIPLSCGAAPITWPLTHKCDHPTGRICLSPPDWDWKALLAQWKGFKLVFLFQRLLRSTAFIDSCLLSEMHHHHTRLILNVRFNSWFRCYVC